MSADLMRLGEQVSLLAECGAKFLHFDVMDGRFCPALTAGSFFVKGIKTPLWKDVHLMVEEPCALIPEFAAAGADLITVHVESGRHLHRALQFIGEQANVNDPARGILRGVALNPGTPLYSLGAVLDEVDAIFLVAVNPGFPKQRFIEGTSRKFQALKSMVGVSSHEILLGIDGGVTRENIGPIASWGAQVIVAGSAVFEGNRIRENFDTMLRQIRKGKEP